MYYISLRYQILRFSLYHPVIKSAPVKLTYNRLVHIKILLEEPQLSLLQRVYWNQCSVNRPNKVQGFVFKTQKEYQVELYKFFLFVEIKSKNSIE